MTSYHGPRGRFTKPLRTVTPQMSVTRTPEPDRFQSRVNQSWEAEQRRERHVRYVALVATSFVTVFAVLVSFVWLAANIPDVHAIVRMVQP